MYVDVVSARPRDSFSVPMGNGNFTSAWFLCILDCTPGDTTATLAGFVVFIPGELATLLATPVSTTWFLCILVCTPGDTTATLAGFLVFIPGELATLLATPVSPPPSIPATILSESLSTLSNNRRSHSVILSISVSNPVMFGVASYNLTLSILLPKVIRGLGISAYGLRVATLSKALLLSS